MERSGGMAEPEYKIQERHKVAAGLQTTVPFDCDRYGTCGAT